MTRFVSEAIEPDAGSLIAPTQGLPELPGGFWWRGRLLIVGELIRSWRSTKDDRGDTYLDRLWFDFIAADGARAVVYFDKHAKRRGERWRLYTIEDSSTH